MAHTKGRQAVHLWVQDRRDNCALIAMGKSGADRDGWLEDGAYFQAVLDQLAVNADLLAALRTVLDQVDYMADPPNCRLNEMVGAVLPQEVIARARAVIARVEPPGTDQGSTLYEEGHK